MSAAIAIYAAGIFAYAAAVELRTRGAWDEWMMLVCAALWPLSVLVTTGALAGRATANMWQRLR